jgi:hypothetical protein
MFKNYIPQSDRSHYYFFDDFGGGNFDDRVWEYGGTTGGSITKLAALAGQINVVVGSVAGNDYYIAQAAKNNFDPSSLIDLCWRIKIPDRTYLAAQIGFEADSTHYIHLRSNSDVSAYWVCQVQSGAGSTQVISSLAVDTNWHLLRIIGTSAAMNFFVDSTLLTTIATNIPTVALGPIVYTYRHTGGSGTRLVTVDWVEATGARA